MTTHELTFLFTDIEGSTRLWEEHADVMDDVLAVHDAILTRAVTDFGGTIFKHLGDGIGAVFDLPVSAMRAAAAAQREITQQTWPAGISIAVRMGIHSGEAERHDADYFGRPLNATSRLESAAHGGQVLISGDALRVAGITPRGSVPVENATLEDLGFHHLRDLATAMHIHQLSIDGLPNAFPPIRTLETVQGNLPIRLGDLVGRDEILQSVLKGLREQGLVTLSGFGGSGKTRLALHAAAEASPEFRDGAWFCEFAPIHDASAVEPALASLLRIHDRPGLSLRESIITALIPQQALIVLDNCEHLVEPIAQMTAAIVSRCPNVKLLVTSLEPLNIASEYVIPVPPLSLNVAATAGAQLSPAAQLFLERASAASPGFTITEANRAVVEAVCAHLDGLPLAIELTAPRVVSLPMEAIEERLSDRFRLLSRGPRVEDERHRTLRNVVEWAYSLLSEDERQLALRLAIFPGSFDLEAVESVCFIAGDDRYAIAELIEQLIARSIVLQAAGALGPRFSMLETLRQYGIEQLEKHDSNSIARLREAHADHFLELVGRAGEHMAGSEEARWTRLLDLEFANIRAAISHAVEAGSASDAVAAVSVMGEFGIWRVRYECADWAVAALNLPGADADPHFPHAAGLAGLMTGMRGDVPAALMLFGRALAAEEQHKLPKSWLVRLGLGLGSSIGGQAASADEFHRQALDIARASGDPAVLALTLAQVLNDEAIFRDTSGKIAMAEEALWLAKELGNPTRIAWALGVQSTALRETDPDLARSLALEALDQARSVDNRYVESSLLTGIGLLDVRKQGTREALERLADLLESWYAAGNWGQLWPLIRNAAYVLADLEPTETLAILLGAERASDWTAGKTEPERAREQRCLETLDTALGADALGHLIQLGASTPLEQVFRLAQAELQRHIGSVPA